MPTEAELLAKVQESIATAIGAETSELTPDKKLFQDLGVDSVDFLDISYEVERETGFDVTSIFQDQQPDAELTIQGLVDLLKAKLG
jgi:acyl carrier protein